MKNNTKVRLHLSKQLFESLTREIIKEAKANDGYTVAVKQPKMPKQSKAQSASPEVQKTDTETKMEAAPASVAANSASKLGADMIKKGQAIKSTPGLSSQEVKTIQSILDLITAKAPQGETAVALQKALNILTQNTKNVEPGSKQPDNTAAPVTTKPTIPGLKEMETAVAEEGKDTLKEYEHHYEMVNGQCRRYNDEGEYEVVSSHYCR